MKPQRHAVIACIDGSSYLGSVCDDAAWIGGRIGGGVELLHVTEDEPPDSCIDGSGEESLRRFRDGRSARMSSDPVVRAAAMRLIEQGADVLEMFSAEGEFADLTARLARNASFVVLGRRGLDTEAASGGLGEGGA